MDDPFFARAESEFIGRTVSPRVLRVIKHQTGRKPNIIVDREKLALKPGKRISKNGKIYWETRKDRSDVIPKKRL
jgi:hypothetical protein